MLSPSGQINRCSLLSIGQGQYLRRDYFKPVTRVKQSGFIQPGIFQALNKDPIVFLSIHSLLIVFLSIHSF